MAESSYWKDLELKFPDGSTRKVCVDTQTFNAAMEGDQAVIESLCTNYLDSVNDGDTDEVPCIMSQMIGKPEFDCTETDTCQEKESSTWRHEEILLLLSLWEENREKFSSSSYKQKDIWTSIGKSMGGKGYHRNGNSCNEKFRAMKHRHKVIHDSNRQSGRDRRTWTYFERMEELMAGDPAITPVRCVASASHSLVQEKTPVKRSEMRNTVSDNSNETPLKRRKTNDPPEWFLSFMETNNLRLTAIEKSNEKMVKIEEERNLILKRIADALLKD